MTKNEIVLFNDESLQLEVPITPEQETVWLTQEQMSDLFMTARSSIAYHITNIFKEGELDRSTSVEIFDKSEGKASRPPMYYNLDVIISVGYRVKSKRGVAFRKWANKVLKEYLLNGYAINDNRLEQLDRVIRIMKRTQDALDAKQVLTVIERFNHALYSRLEKIIGEVNYESCRSKSNSEAVEGSGYWCSIVRNAVPSNIKY